MLRGASLYLASRFDRVTVMARDSARLTQLANAARKKNYRINSLCVDYHDNFALRSGLENTIHAYGPITLVLAWIHSTAPHASIIVAETLAQANEKCRYFEIVGSAAAGPAQIAENQSKRFEQFSSIQYRQIVLGFMIEQGRSRWLTNDEISAGVIRAVMSDEIYSIVGTVRPWSARP